MAAQTPQPAQITSSMAAFWLSRSIFKPGHLNTRVQSRLQPHCSARQRAGSTDISKPLRPFLVGLRAHAWLAGHPGLYHTLTAVVIRLLHALGRKRGSFSRLPFAVGWTSQRDFPAPQETTFMQLYKSRLKQHREQ